MDLAQVFLTPDNATHRQYEALRAYVVEQLPGPEVARRFGYTPGSLHQLIHQFRRQPHRQFFVEPPPPGGKQNQSIYDISEALKKEDIHRTPAAVAAVLRQEGFAKLPRRGDAERPPGTRPTAADRGRSRRRTGVEP